jgi:diguanylate cyclase (GGDEF)-like protein
MLLDLDGLKDLNDGFGHPVGDMVLRNLANRIRSALRGFDTAARIGGDEFAVVLPRTDVAGAHQVAQRILSAIRDDPPRYKDEPVPMSASVGVAQFEAGWTGAALVSAADHAMYEAKRGGRDQVALPPDAEDGEAPFRESTPTLTKGARWVDSDAESPTPRTNS